MQPLFDHALLKHRLKLLNAAQNPFLLSLTDELCFRLAPIKRSFERSLLLYPPSPTLGDTIENAPQIETLETLALTAHSNIESLNLNPHSYDTIFSFLGLHYANDVPGVLKQMKRALKPGGYVAGCLLGGETLKDLRDAFARAETDITGGITPRVHPAIDIRQMGALLQRAGFIEPIVDLEKFDLRYESTRHLLRDLKEWSAGNLLIERSKKMLRRDVLRALDTHYPRTNDHIIARFDLIWFSGWVSG